MSMFLSTLPAENTKAVEQAISYATAKDVVIVIAAGNNAAYVDEYPGDNDTVIIAGASVLNDTRWEDPPQEILPGQKIVQGSCYGPRLTVMAPVENLTIAQPHDATMYHGTADGPIGEYNYEFESMYEEIRIGATSSAAPIVSALAALVRSIRPDLSAREVIKIIKLGADDIGEKGYDIYTGYGRVNFFKTAETARGWAKN